MKKICIFSRPFHPAVGGLEQIAKTLANEFSILGFDVEVVTDTKESKNETNDFPFKITRTSSFKKRYDSFKYADVILFMNFTFAGVPAALLSRSPIVLSHHGIYDSKSNLKVRLLEFTKRQLTRFFPNISVSSFVAKNLPGRSSVIPNAYDDQLFSYKESLRTKDFVFCGRLVDAKGVKLLLDAFEKVIKAFPNSSLTIIGDGPEYPSLVEQSKSIAPSGNVTFTGTLRGNHLVDALREHTCMVIPSIWEEPFGIVALEGIASCKTVIASSRGGLPEAIANCGTLVEPTADALYEAMIDILHAQQNGALLPGQPSDTQRAEHLAKHSAKGVAQHYIDILKKATNK
ncbi:glycosyltransferase family 4 protein [Pseudomonas helleri]|uniref:glycosyltransferase family 4 protein n=1 Tax=Pseudomonas helleri TaxID=1608996 RepID=UPI0009E3F694|nr:glycosyltransferase family 4 protein [Pseudomonas helleri]